MLPEKLSADKEPVRVRPPTTLKSPLMNVSPVNVDTPATLSLVDGVVTPRPKLPSYVRESKGSALWNQWKPPVLIPVPLPA